MSEIPLAEDAVGEKSTPETSNNNASNEQQVQGQSHVFFTHPEKEKKFDKTRYASFQEAKEDRKRKHKERRANKQEHKEVGFSNNLLKQTDYYFENGLRKVYPYWFGWTTWVKERWFGRTLLDIYTTEFMRAVAHVNVKELIETGRIRVNGQPSALDYKLKNGDRVTHCKHRHEIAVIGDPIRILHDDEDYLVVDKPCSIPMHPCGKYRYNSLNIILIKEFGYANLRSE
jgi:lysosomal alpha-mannosidase